jgi:hypothetical protein
MCVAVREGAVTTASTVDGSFLAGADLEEANPIALALSDFGFCAIAFEGEGGPIQVLDQNLVTIGKRRIGRTVRSWRCVSWGDGVDYLLVATQDNALLMLSLPFLEERVLPLLPGFVAVEIEFLASMRLLVLIDPDGRLYRVFL